MFNSRMRGRVRKYAPSGGMIAPPPRRIQPAKKRVGIQDLPLELLWEMLSNFPPSRCEMKKPTQEDFELAADRRATLIALSQTCGYFRRVFRPHAYDAIQVFTGLNRGCYKYLPDYNSKNPGMGAERPEYLFAKELVRQIQVVTIRDPSLASLVKSIDVTILGYKQISILTELARCMRRLPNLKNVYINIAVGSPDLTPFIGRFNFPQVHGLRVSRAAQRLIHCCPNLRHLGVAGGDFSGISYQYYLIRLHNLESISIPFQDQYNFADIARDMPFVRSITFDYNATLTYLSSRGKASTTLYDKFWPHLAKLKHLHVIRVKQMPESVWTGKSNALLGLVMDTWVSPALEILRSIRGGKVGKQQEKKLVLRWENKMRTFSA